jgi:DNA-binding response OmpR family regulator
MKMKRRILIVDDEPGFTRLLKLNLEDTGDYEVRVENQACSAFETAREFKPDLVFLDVMMPGMDGGDVSARLQASSATKSIPIVFLTAAVRKEEVGAHGGRIGGFPYIAKPADLPEVVACIERHLVPRE